MGDAAAATAATTRTTVGESAKGEVDIGSAAADTVNKATTVAGDRQTTTSRHTFA